MSYVGNNPTIQQYAPTIAYFSGTGSQTVFTLPISVVSAAQILVVVGNVPQNPASAFSVSGTTLTFTSAPASGTNNIWVQYTSLQTNTIAPSAGTVGQAQMNNPTGTGNPVLQTIPTLINPQITSNIQMLSADAGVIFNKTGALNNQVLNDYEYGSFTPSFKATGASFTYSYQSGYYVKVGKMVTCFMAVLASATSGASGSGAAVSMGNLPFAAQGGALYWIPASCGNWGTLNTNVMWVGGNASSGTDISVYCTTGINTSVRQMTANDIANAPFITMSITYPTAS